MTNDKADQETKKEAVEETRGLNNPTQVEQDNRVARVAAEVKAKQEGSGEPAKDLNKDG